MADAATTIYAFVKPEVGASADSWGGKLNGDFDDLDALLGVLTTTGSSNAYVLTTGLSLAAYVSGQRFAIKANFTNSSTVTIAVDGLATKAITKNGTTALASGDIVSGTIYIIAYDGTQFQLLGVATGVYQPLDATLTAWGGVTFAADKLGYSTGVDAFSTLDFLSWARSFISAATAAAGLTAVGLGTGDSPQLTAVNLGHASNTTLGQGSAPGIIAVEGVDQVSVSGSQTLANKTLTSPVTNTPVITGGSITPSATATANEPGYLGAPQNSRSADYTLALTDAGKKIYHPAADTTGRTITIPANASVAFAVDTVIIIRNAIGAGALSIPITSDTLKFGASGTGTRSLAAGGTAWITKDTSTVWTITGDSLLS